MSHPDDRIEELIAAAVAGQASPSERDELDRLRREHPWIDEEIEALRAVDARLHDADTTWVQPDMTDALRDRILREIPTQRPRDVDDTPVLAADADRPAPRRSWVTPVLAAACLALGLAIGFGTPALTSIAPSGPPGTLGAVEPIDVRDEVAGVEVDADLVAHTWGTEAVLDATGLDVGSTYMIVFIAADGREFPAGEMLGSDVPIHCRVNAAVLREDAVRLEIRNADESLVALADLPEA